MSTSVIWFRKDLRVRDNPTLKDAQNQSDQLIPLYVFNPEEFDKGMFGMDKIGDYRTKFLWESVKDLRDNLRSLGGELVVRSGDSRKILSNICDEYNVDTVYTQTMPSTQELKREKETIECTDSDFERYWTHTLYHPNDLENSYRNMDDTFTPWRKETQYNVDVRERLSKPQTITLNKDINAGEMPSPSDFDLSSDEPSSRSFIEFKGGESNGLERLNRYIWKDDRLRDYKQTRNGLLGEGYSSKFSPWLAHGCLSPRFIYEEVKRYEDERVSNDSTYWLVFELMWRDFFQFQFMKHGGDFFTQSGIRDIEYDWSQNMEILRAWMKGKTGVPFVDANMRELNETGYMSNRGRQNVASFLADVLDIDWRMGAMYFQSRLIDYDVCSNWGNWAYVAGVGNDSREDRYFNVIKQGKKYDSNGEYVRHWIPELENLPSDATHEPWLMTEAQQKMYDVKLGDDYPEPLFDMSNKSYKHLIETSL